MKKLSEFHRALYLMSWGFIYFFKKLSHLIWLDMLRPSQHSCATLMTEMLIS